jgi:glyoxylase-like metal-dependent hydrolase (beta-lactamase superfamily II)
MESRSGRQINAPQGNELIKFPANILAGGKGYYMIEQITDTLYRIPVPLLGNPLKELNSYFIRGDEGDLLIDLGFRTPECRAALTQGLAELGSKPERRDILLTHLHSDHSGLANEFVGPERRIFISEGEKQYLGRILAGETSKPIHDRLASEGFPENLLKHIEATNLGRIKSLDRLTPQFRGLLDGEILRVGAYSLQTVVVPGHTPSNAMFWIEEQRILFTGDHVLFDITPNITTWTGVEDALGDYLDSLCKTLNYPADLALPGHRKPGNYQERVRRLLEHHEHRLAQSLSIVAETPGLTAYEIASRMTWEIRADSWETFPAIQKWFAVGECLSHLDYLRKRKRIVREMGLVSDGASGSETEAAFRRNASASQRGGVYRYFWAG